ncbi:MAG: NnrU family protein [Siculibacillus sp.]|nr:NnrU family protein [Siculibacillus sp.]
MNILVLGLALFLLVHTVPMLGALRATLVGRLGENGWRGVHTLISALGLGLIIWGFAQARWDGASVWFESQKGMRHAVWLVLAPVFPLLFAAYLPGWIQARVVHPMLTAVILWAVGHLLHVGSAPAVTLFAAFGVWAVADRLSLARRSPGRPAVPPFGRNDAIAIVLGLAVYGLFLWKAHLWLIGVSPLG